MNPAVILSAVSSVNSGMPIALAISAIVSERSDFLGDGLAIDRIELGTDIVKVYAVALKGREIPCLAEPRNASMSTGS